MKRVYSDNAEIAHLWAHQKQYYARNPRDNFYFYGETIYSYGSHFPCGVIAHNKRGETAYILNSNRYSPTTDKHQHLVNSALADTWACFHSPQCKAPTVYQYDKKYYTNFNNVLEYMSCHLCKIYEYIKKQLNARKYSYIDCVLKEIREIREYIKFYGLNKASKWALRPDDILSDNTIETKPSIIKWFLNKKNVTTIEKLANDNGYDGAIIISIAKLLQQHKLLEESMELTDNAIAKIIGEFSTEQGSIEKELLKAKEKVNKALLQKDLENLNEWHNDIKKFEWKPSSVFVDKKKWHTALRIRNNKIETSKGIVLNFEEGKRLWKIVLAFHEGAVFKHDLALDVNGLHWALNRYEKDILEAGCHRIHFSECERIAKILGWDVK